MRDSPPVGRVPSRVGEAHERSELTRTSFPALGARKLRELSADDVDRWLADKAKTLSTDTLHKLHSILKRSVTRAQARDKVKRNVVLVCEIPEGRDGRLSPSPSTRPRRS